MGLGGRMAQCITDCLVGMDERLATHFAHLFIRDPLVVFKETLEPSPENQSSHFEARVSHSLPTVLETNSWVEHTIYKLAANAFQASTTWRQHWLESRVPQHGSSINRF